MVSTRFEPSVGVWLMFARKLTKAEEKEIFFFEPYLSCFLLSLSFFFAAKIISFS
jgi:hypothetical protein